MPTSNKQSLHLSPSVVEQAGDYCQEKMSGKVREDAAVDTDKNQRNREGAGAREGATTGGGTEQVLRAPGLPAAEENGDEKGFATPGSRKGPKNACPSKMRDPSPSLWPQTPVGDMRAGSSSYGILYCAPKAIATVASCLCATCLCNAGRRDRIVTDDCCHSLRGLPSEFVGCISGFGRGFVELIRSLAPLVVIEAISLGFSAVLGCFIGYIWNVFCGVLGLYCCECGSGDDQC